MSESNLQQPGKTIEPQQLPQQEQSVEQEQPEVAQQTPQELPHPLDQITVAQQLPKIKHAAMMFSVAVFLFLYIAAYFQRKNFSSGVLITEFIIIAMPPILFAKYLGLNLRFTFRLNKVSVSNLLCSALILIFSLPLVGAFNILYVFFLKKFFGNISVDKLPQAQDIPQLFLLFFIIGVSAGICEEVLFRGFIMRGFERLGAKKAIFIAAILFCTLHIKIEKLPATFLLGAIIGFAVYRTNSIFTGMFMHFTNNSISTFMAFLLNKAEPRFDPYANEPGTAYTDVPNLDLLFANSAEKTIAIVFIIIFIATVILICSFILFSLVNYLIKNTRDVTLMDYNNEDIKENSNINKINANVKEMLWLLPGIGVIFLLCVNQGMELLNMPFGTVQKALELLRLTSS